MPKFIVNSKDPAVAQELKSFEKELKFVDYWGEEGFSDDYQTKNKVFLHSSGVYYSTEVTNNGGIYSKDHYLTYVINGLEWVSFEKVEPRTIETVVWDVID